jgi:hypothetical protein
VGAVLSVKQRRILQVAVALVLIAVASALAHMHVQSQTYHPVVRLSSPDALTYTAVQDPVAERRACGAANDRFLGPIKAACKACQVVYARCERRLDGLERAIYSGAPLEQHRVIGPGLRMAIDGPAETAKAACEYLAGDMVKRGVRSAACVLPEKSR